MAAFERSMPRCFATTLVLYMAPREVASSLPLEPPTTRGLPVTTPGTE